MNRLKFIAATFWIILFLTAIFAWAEPHGGNVQKKQSPETVCPVTRLDTGCMTCHSMRVDENGKPYFGLNPKYYDRELNYAYPNKNTKIKNGKGYYILTDIGYGETEDIVESLKFFDEQGIDHVIFQVYSPGGSLIAAWKIVSLMQEWMGEGKIIETQCRGYAASAGFLIFASGSVGHRYTSPTSENMWHEVAIYSMKMGIYKDTPGKLEDKAEIFRHLQNTANQWLADRSKMTKVQLDAVIHKDEFWLTGEEMVERGFADKFLWHNE